MSSPWDFDSDWSNVQNAVSSFVNSFGGVSGAEDSRAMVKALSRLFENSISNRSEAIYEKDYMLLLAEVLELVNKGGKEARVDTCLKFLELSQVLVSNSRSSRELGSLVSLPGFARFFRAVEVHLSFDEVADYWVNIVKSLSLKLDAQIPFDQLGPIFTRTFLLQQVRDNMVHTALRTIAIVLLRSEAPSVQSFTRSTGFLNFFLLLAQTLVDNIFDLDRLAGEEKVALTATSVANLQNSLCFLEEVLETARSEDIRRVVANVMLTRLVFHTLLPPLRNDLSRTRAKVSISVSLFMFNQLFEHLRHPAFQAPLLEHFILRDFLPNVPLEMSFYSVTNPEALRTMAADNFPVLSPRSESNFLNMLVLFLTTKDDNLLIIIANLLLHILSLRPGLLTSKRAELASTISAQLSMDPPYRGLTESVLANLLARIAPPAFPKKLFETLRKKTLNLRRVLTIEKLRPALLKSFRATGAQDRPPFFSLAPAKLDWQCILNYNTETTPREAKEFRNLPLGLKYFLSPEETVESELLSFIVIKNLRYRLHPESFLLESDKYISLKYESLLNALQPATPIRLGEPTKAEPPHEPLSLLFQDAKFIVKSTSANALLFSEFFNSLIFYVDKFNPRQLNLTSRTSITIWHLLFDSATSCLNAKTQIEQIIAKETQGEAILVESFLKKTDVDCT